MTIEAQAKLIAGLAETMKDSDWADEIIQRCAMIEKAAAEIRRMASRRLGGER